MIGMSDDPFITTVQVKLYSSPAMAFPDEFNRTSSEAIN